MNTLINTATSTFQTTTGFTYSDLVSWMGDILKLIVGSGLGVLDSLKGWIIALVVIGAVVYFIYRGFRFFRH